VVAAAAVAIDREKSGDILAAVDFFDGAGEFAAGGIAIVDFAVAENRRTRWGAPGISSQRLRFPAANSPAPSKKSTAAKNPPDFSRRSLRPRRRPLSLLQSRPPAVRFTEPLED